jgi:hypothetical protein
VNVPLLTVVEPKFQDAIALFDAVLLYNRTVSNAVDNVTVPYDKAAPGCQ